MHQGSGAFVCLKPTERGLCQAEKLRSLDLVKLPFLAPLPKGHGYLIYALCIMRQAYIYAPRALQPQLGWVHSLGMAKSPKKPKPPKVPKFPNNIGLWRDALPGMTQEKLGGLINRTQETVGRYESGEINPPTSILKAIAKVLKCTTVDLIDGVPGEGDAIMILVRDMKPETRRRVAVVVKAMKEAEG